MESKNPISGNVQSSGLDFRSSDDAWYGVDRLVLRDETLIIKYCDFSDQFDDRFNAGDFKSGSEVEDFAERFRRTSFQLQDQQCSKVIEGIRVCVSYKFSDFDIKFYDAIVEEVNYKDHIFQNGEEVCTCNFVVFWEHGPNAGAKTSTSVEHICLIQPHKALTDPALTRFLKMSREKIGMVSSDSSSIAKNDGLSHDSSSIAKNDGLTHDAGTSHNRVQGTVDVKMKSTLSKSLTFPLKETKNSKLSVSTGRTYEGRHSIDWKRSGQDVDLGGKSIPADNLCKVGDCHFILIENLEKDLTPSTIVEFIRRHISISSQAHVFPCLSSESYARGTISVDSQEKLLRLSNFLNNPGHLILSSRGRPWVIFEKHNAVGATVANLKSEPKSQPCDRSPKVGSKLKIATFGTDEYKKGKQLMGLFMEFAGHIKQLHKKLDSEERRILQSSDDYHMSISKMVVDLCWS